jgi:hypothetical protein
MPLINKTSLYHLQKIKLNSDDNKSISSIKNSHFHIVTSSEETSKIINIPFEYNIDDFTLEVYLNGILLRSYDNEYGDYEKTNNHSITFDDDIIFENDHLFFKMRYSGYKNNVNDNTNNIQQLKKDIFGEKYKLYNNGIRSNKIINDLIDGETTINLNDYKI